MSVISEKEIIKKILTSSKVIAVVGISSDSKRPSNYVAKYLLLKGYKIIPVNPNMGNWEGLICYPALQSIPNTLQVDAVVVFRKAQFCLEIAEAAVEINAKAIWLQEGIISKETELFAKENGLLIVMNRCMKKEHEKWKSGSDSQK
ncbi:MAG: CoA-binding protein [Candidatus Micrarchaeota archaeon]